MYYAVFTILYIISSLIYKYDRKIFYVWFFIFIIFLFSALRYDAGYDYFFYIEMIQGVRPSFMIEPISRFLMSIAKTFSHPQIFFILNSFIYVYFTALALKNFSSLSFISIFLWCFAPLSLLTSFGLVRQYTAMSCIFLALSFFYNKKYTFGFFLSILAILFHKSAIIFISILLISRQLKKSYSTLIYIILLSLAYFIVPKIAFYVSDTLGLYQNYFENKSNDNGGKIMFLLIFIFFTNQIIASINRISSSDFWYSHNLFFLAIFIYYGLSQFGEHVARVSYYLVPFLYISTHKIYFALTIKKRVIYLSILIAFCTISFLGTLYFSAQNPTRDALNNYQLYFIVNIV